MFEDNRPMETLAAYAVTFVSGMMAAAAIKLYADWVEKRTL